MDILMDVKLVDVNISLCKGKFESADPTGTRADTAGAMYKTSAVDLPRYNQQLTTVDHFRNDAFASAATIEESWLDN